MSEIEFEIINVNPGAIVLTPFSSVQLYKVLSVIHSNVDRAVVASLKTQEPKVCLTTDLSVIAIPYRKEFIDRTGREVTMDELTQQFK